MLERKIPMAADKAVQSTLKDLSLADISHVYGSPRSLDPLLATGCPLSYDLINVTSCSDRLVSSIEPLSLFTLIPSTPMHGLTQSFRT